MDSASGHDPQQEAIDVIDRNLQIIACAGSGKTRVVAARIVNILRREGANGITPENIVAFTFTDKAAAELKDRITRFFEVEFGHTEGLAGITLVQISVVAVARQGACLGAWAG